MESGVSVLQHGVVKTPNQYRIASAKSAPEMVDMTLAASEFLLEKDGEEMVSGRAMA